MVCRCFKRVTVKNVGIVILFLCLVALVTYSDSDKETKTLFSTMNTAHNSKKKVTVKEDSIKLMEGKTPVKPGTLSERDKNLLSEYINQKKHSEQRRLTDHDVAVEKEHKPRRHTAEKGSESNKRPISATSGLTDRGTRKFEMLGRTDMFQSDRKCTNRLPDAIIFGVMKAGTEAFSTYLTINPYVAMSLNVRSTLFFTKNYKKGLDWYKSQMTCSTDEQVTIDKAPQYFSDPGAPKRVHDMNKNIKLILIVRNPIDRAVSHYLQVKNSKPKLIGTRSFESMVFYSGGHVRSNSGFISLSRYSVILKRWYRYFKKSQILVLDGDKFKNDQISVLSKAERFLGIKRYIKSDKFIFDKEKGFYCLNVGGEKACLGNGKGREHPTMSATHYNQLKEYFKPYNAELNRLTGENFNW